MRLYGETDDGKEVSVWQTPSNDENNYIVTVAGVDVAKWCSKEAATRLFNSYVKETDEIESI